MAGQALWNSEAFVPQGFIATRSSAIAVHRYAVHRYRGSSLSPFIAARLPRGIAKRVFHGVHRYRGSSLSPFIAARFIAIAFIAARFIAARLPRGIAKRVFHGVHRFAVHRFGFIAIAVHRCAVHRCADMRGYQPTA
jgi:hypothetical protein